MSPLQQPQQQPVLQSLSQQAPKQMSSKTPHVLSRRQKKSKLPGLLVILAIVASITAYYFYSLYGKRFFSKEPAGAARQETKELPFRDIDWERTLFADPAFQALKPFVPENLNVPRGFNPNPFTRKEK